MLYGYGFRRRITYKYGMPGSVCARRQDSEYGREALDERSLIVVVRSRWR
jgi:hypothetical protein